MIVPTGALLAKGLSVETGQPESSSPRDQVNSPLAPPVVVPQQNGGYEAYLSQRKTKAFQALLDIRRKQMETAGGGIANRLVPSGMAFGGAAAAAAAINGLQSNHSKDEGHERKLLPVDEARKESPPAEEESSSPYARVAVSSLLSNGMGGSDEDVAACSSETDSARRARSQRLPWEPTALSETFGTREGIASSQAGNQYNLSGLQNYPSKHRKRCAVALAISKAVIAKERRSRGSASSPPHMTEEHKNALRGWLRRQWSLQYRKVLYGEELEKELELLMGRMQSARIDAEDRQSMR